MGHQDTLFTGPLPNESVHNGGFTGPKEFSPRINGLQWYENCYIEGDVDFILLPKDKDTDMCLPTAKSRVQWSKTLGVEEKREYDELLFRIKNDWDADTFADIR